MGRKKGSTNKIKNVNNIKNKVGAKSGNINININTKGNKRGKNSKSNATNTPNNNRQSVMPVYIPMQQQVQPQVSGDTSFLNHMMTKILDKETKSYKDFTPSIMAPEVDSKKLITGPSETLRSSRLSEIPSHFGSDSTLGGLRTMVLPPTPEPSRTSTLLTPPPPLSIAPPPPIGAKSGPPPPPPPPPER